jgi:hypothetical protein
MQYPVMPSLSHITISRGVEQRRVKDKCGKQSCGIVIYFKLFGENCMNSIITGQIFLSNYELPKFLK